MANVANILVLMTTHNAQEHLADQLDSILDQDDVNVHLHISDDCSDDSTFRILETYASEHDNISIRYNVEHQGTTRSMMKLIYDAPADEFDFVALANQDDIWHPGKLAAGIAHITANTSRPELYYCGAQAIDARGKVLGALHDGYEVCADHPASLLLTRNWAHGGCMLMNGALVKLLRRRKVYDFERPYDAWVHAVALYCDGYVFCDLRHCYLDRRLDRHAYESMQADDMSQEFAARCTVMAQVLLREYERMMDADTAKLVEAVSVRHVSGKARRYLAGRTDIVLPTGPRTSKMRWKILTSKF